MLTCPFFSGKHLLSVPSSQNWKAFPFLTALPKMDSDPFHVLSLSKILKEIQILYNYKKFWDEKISHAMINTLN